MAGYRHTLMKDRTFSTKAFIQDLFRIEQHPRRGLLPAEWVVIIYLTATLLVTLFAYTRLSNPDGMIRGRMSILAVLAALWVVYQLVPCRFTEMLRTLAQMALLGWWYPDTYHLNGLLPNLDPLFARMEQTVFGFQPALLFARHFPQTIVSEAMCMGYAFYFLFITEVFLFYFICRFREFERGVFIILASFFSYYLIFDLLPVTGPMFYYKAVGVGAVAHGIFPEVGDYFLTHTDFLPTPGNPSGFFYQMVADVHTAGERPTAAFPSSHVGIATVCLMLIWRSRNRLLLWLSIPFYILLCLSTVYIMAHYAIDAVAGLVTGIAFYFLFLGISKKMTTFAPSQKHRRK